MSGVVARIPLHGEAELLGALAAHVDACVRDLRRIPQPPLYSAGVRYFRADPNERWQLPSETRARGGGDCEDLASWRCAERRIAGESCRVVVRRTGPTVLHAVVEGPDGVEDPSKKLGMGRPSAVQGAAMRSNLKWKLKRTADGWEGEAEVPLPGAGASVSARARGRTRGDAAARTLRAIEDVSRSPLVSSLLPPGASVAIKSALSVARSVAKLFKKKKKRSAVSGLDVLGAEQVAAALAQRGAPPELVRLGRACWGE